ncbi:hypothetical protein ACIQPR_47360 [Streptomyces sp. NPDC091280]|uniref:hypothetical protein n=1 Tax=Streptomyces sp. NPDC091280 TaxID=3365984 RepID=UPI0038021CA8
MSTAFMPQQPHQPQQPRAATPSYATESTRLLCAGAYLDPLYRDRVIDELYVNEQRIVAPSSGFDAARVLAHALRARRLDLAWSGAIVGLWVVGTLVTDFWLLLFLLPSLMLAMANKARGRAERPTLVRRWIVFYLRWSGRFFLLGVLVVTLADAFTGKSAASSSAGTTYDSAGYPTQSAPSISNPALGFLGGFFGAHSSSNGPGALGAWLTIFVLVLVVASITAQRSQVTRALGAELSHKGFADAVADPAYRGGSGRSQRLAERIRTEQHAPLIMYREAHPFCGAGTPHDTWVLAVELRPDGMKTKRPICNRSVLETIRPLLEQLRESSEFAQHPVRDRLRRLEIDECVFLPVEGLRRREMAPYGDEVFATHRERAVEEGAEKRRHFLRVRVGGWDEELVVTVFVRIHTQGRMLMLEIAPHVLQPVREDFKDADRVAHRFRHNHLIGKAAATVPQVPRAIVTAVVTLGRTVAYGWRLLTGGYAGALPEGPALSVRELGSAPSGSLFQEMDVDRYLRSVQDRVSHGVRIALAEAGYQTGEFVQKIVNISNGGVNIDSVEGSNFAIGERASASTTAASTTTGGQVPQKGPDTT